MSNIGTCQVCGNASFWLHCDGAMWSHKCCSEACLYKLYVSLAEMSEVLARNARNAGEKLGFEFGAKLWRAEAKSVAPKPDYSAMMKSYTEGSRI